MNNDAPQGTSASGQDPKGLEAKPAGPVGAADAQNLSSSSPDMLQEAALREALDKCRAQFDFYATEHRAKVEAASTAYADAIYWGNVEEQDYAWKELEKRRQQTATNEGMVAMIDAALSLPQQAATDEGEPVAVPEVWQLVPVEITQAMLDATCCNEGDDAEMRLTWKELLYAAPKPPILPTPTAQPHAAETRLREALDEAKRGFEAVQVLLSSMAGGRPSIMVETFIERIDAALTQPEPTAQQGVSAMGFNAAYKTWEARHGLKPFVPTVDAFEAGWIAALSSQQAAGEAEAVGYMLRHKETGAIFWDEDHCIWTHKPDAEEAAEESGDHEAFALYATPQPTETQRIVAWLREDACKTREDLRRLHAARKLTIAQTAEWENLIALKSGIAAAIEAGEHRQSADTKKGD